jgi:16S rRNA G966 N2-methylase RsmD
LKSQPAQSFDVVYIDPMFEEPVIESDGIKALSQFALHEDLDEELITDALRVAKKRVVLKDYFRSSRFEKYGFEVIRRKTAKFHFGILEK